MTKRTGTIFIIILLGIILRIYNVASYPAGFYSDESLVGYEANSILKTGKDQYGNFLPVTFKAFGDYRPGLYIYSTVPFIYIFGLSEFGTRLPSVLFSSFTIPIVILISKELFRKWKIALLGGLIFAVSPWSIQFARMAHDTNLATLLASIAILALVKDINGRNHILWVFIFSALSLYVYYTTRVFVPFFLVIVFFIYWQKLKQYKKSLLKGFIVSIILLVPLLLVLSNRNTGWSRIDSVSLLGDKGILANTLQFHLEDKDIGNNSDRLFHNKLVDTTIAFFGSYTSHLDPRFLFISGDPNRLYNTPGNGILLYTELVFIIIGLLKIIRSENPFKKFIIVWIVLGLIPDAFTRFAPASARIHLVLPIVSIIGGLGLYYLFDIGKKKTMVLKVSEVALTVLFLYNLSYFLHANLIHQSVRYGKEWTYGIKQVAEYIKVNGKHYDKIWISPAESHWVTYLFYLQYPPEKTQREISLSAKNEYGLGWVYSIDKYRFDKLPRKFDYAQNILYVAHAEEFCKYIKPEKVVYYLNRDIAFYLVTTSELKRVEQLCSDLYDKAK